VQALAPAGADVSVAWNPEFLREGRAVQDTLRPDRLVLGVESPADQQVLLRVYADLVAAGVPVINTDLATAELAKVSANVMLATRISTVNLLAEVCEASGADVGDLTTIIGSDPRIGRDFLTPGLGYGGGCLPKDTRAFIARARELGVGASTSLLEAVDEVNLHQRDRTTEMAMTLLRRSGVGGDGVVAVLGGAFKAESDDVRDSPALDVAGRLHDAGVELRLHDPHAGANVRRERPDLCVVDSVEAACAGADLVLVLTEWPQFAAIDPAELGRLVSRRTVLDTRQVLSPDKWIAAGWDFHALGRGA
jgi:UDPglucose 6-dehydrogenase